MVTYNCDKAQRKKLIKLLHEIIAGLENEPEFKENKSSVAADAAIVHG